MKYWRTMLIASGVAACGLAVWASDSLKDNVPKPAVPVVAAPPAPLPQLGVPADAPKDEPFPRATAAEPSDKEPPLKVLDLAAAAPPSLPVAPPVVPPPIDPPMSFKPVKAELPSALDLPPTPTAPPANEPPPLPKAAFGLPPSSATATPAVDVYPTPPSPQKLSPMLNSPPMMADNILAPKLPVEEKAAIASAQLKPATAVPGAYKLHVRMGGNLGPRFEVRDGETLLLKVYCEHLDLHGKQQGAAVLPGLTASGKVRVSGSGVHGTCDSLTIAAVNGAVMMKGNVKLACYRGHASSEVSAESMSFQLKGTMEVPGKTKASGVSSVSR